MKAKHRNRARPASNPKVRAAAPPPRPVGRWQRRGVILLVSAGSIAAIAWFIARSRRDSLESLDPQAAPQSETASAVSSKGPAERQRSRAANNDDAFIKKVNHGNELLTQGKPDEALEVLTEALAMNPKDEDVHYNLGLALTRLGKFDDAVAHYEEALRLFPEYVEAHNNLGNLLMRMGRLEEAITHFQKAVQIMPDYASAHNNLGTALGKTGRTNEALLHFQQAAKINPDYWEAHFNAGSSLLQQGRLSEAQSEFETVLGLHPDFPPARAALDHIHAQESGPATPGP